ncbi:MAG TPA: UvrD-helicase domain-containing protein, partial [Paracoccaceae bacterium]|nr:UvrD-helicase domain-containing protein [Paracoccaceae bacterium]
MSGGQDARLAQIRATDPGVSAWVAANAGAGKTRALTDRVARLLLGGTLPERVLCLTYTRAAAAEMQERLFRRLGAWAMMPDEALETALQELHEATVTLEPALLARARRLFAQALETPGGLKIQTIHAFCDALLRRFPLEAGISPGFRVADDRSAALMVEAARDGLALRAERGEDAAFDGLAELLSETALQVMMEAVRQQRGLFAQAPERAALAACLGLGRERSAREQIAAIVAGLGAGELRAMCRALLEGGGKDDAPAAEALRLGMGAPPPDAALDAFEAAFLTKEGQKRSARSFPVKAAKAIFPGLGAHFEIFKERIAEVRAERLARLTLDRTMVLHGFARAFLGEFEARKEAAGLVDFDDLVGRARALLTRSDMAAWVLWRLDGGIDHILVDEAQDTSPPQWDLIAALSEEFFAGEGAREARRTLFVVGDLKQSIFSFQGAEPRAFGAMRGRFRARLARTGGGLREVALHHS